MNTIWEKSLFIGDAGAAKEAASAMIVHGVVVAIHFSFLGLLY